ncbi:hypothetical protein HMI56_003896 [Coelomomyces lativittatus]|nr:hypothetical protein HMI56_003896 [Coelomomyces lativittatus]
MLGTSTPPTRTPLHSQEPEEMEGAMIVEYENSVIHTTTMVPKIETTAPLPITHSVPYNKLSEELRRPNIICGPPAVYTTTGIPSPPPMSSTPLVSGAHVANGGGGGVGGTVSGSTTSSHSYAYITKPHATTAPITTEPLYRTVHTMGPTPMPTPTTTTTTTGPPMTEYYPAHIAPSAVGDGPISPLPGSRYRTPAMLPAQRKGHRLIVVAMDDSPSSQRALQWTLNQLLHPERDHLLIVTVATYKTAGFLNQNEEKTQSREFKAQTRAQRTLEYASHQIQDRALRTNQNISYELVSMKAADNYVRDVLVDYVSDIQADLMVMGSRSGGMLRRVEK